MLCDSSNISLQESLNFNLHNATVSFNRNWNSSIFLQNWWIELQSLILSISDLCDFHDKDAQLCSYIVHCIKESHRYRLFLIPILPNSQFSIRILDGKTKYYQSPFLLDYYNDHFLHWVHNHYRHIFSKHWDHNFTLQRWRTVESIFSFIWNRYTYHSLLHWGVFNFVSFLPQSLGVHNRLCWLDVLLWLVECW